MLIEELGYCAPGLREAMGVLEEEHGRPGVAAVSSGDFELPAAVLHSDPLISYSGSVPSAPLGVASVLDGRMHKKPAWFLVSPTWSIEEETTARALRRQAVRHRFVNPLHRILFMCNTDGEAALMRSCGEAAFVHNKTTNVSETVFTPLVGEPIEYDAIYNAQLAPWKRHELTLRLKSCAFLFYRGISSTRESEAALIAHHQKHAPGHVFINEFDDDGVPVRLMPETVNRYLNRASVGLCLSATEGAMFACAEYLLSGLPVVTTPNKGGRDFYLDDDFCITVAADARAVAAGVYELKARGIPRHEVRERTLQLIASERRRFVELINSVYAEAGIAPRFSGFWPLRRPVIMQWIKPDLARRNAIDGIVDDLAPSGSNTIA